MPLTMRKANLERMPLTAYDHGDAGKYE
jgi:hypothetical protein